MIIPKPVGKESKVALIGPASRIKPGIVESLVRLYRESAADFPGGELLVYPSALDANADGSYAAALGQRVADFRDAWGRDDVDMVLCTRGGYGCVHLLDYLDPAFMAAHPKWLVGFSDVSALHALLFKSGVASIHGGMAKQLVENPQCGAAGYRKLLKTLVEAAEPRFAYDVEPHPYNVAGEAEGTLLGGNLAVLNGLAATPYDLMGECTRRDAILFIEDISEPIYAVERMLYRLHLQGVLAKARGIIVGQFTEYRPDRNYDDMYRMIAERLRDWKIACPVAFGFPAGHVDCNVPLIEGAEVQLSVAPDSVRLSSL